MNLNVILPLIPGKGGLCFRKVGGISAARGTGAVLRRSCRVQRRTVFTPQAWSVPARGNTPGKPFLLIAPRPARAGVSCSCRDVEQQMRMVGNRFQGQGGDFCLDDGDIGNHSGLRPCRGMALSLARHVFLRAERGGACCDSTVPRTGHGV